MELSTPQDEHLRQGDVCTLGSFPSWRLDEIAIQTRGNERSLVLPELPRLVSDGDQVLIAVCSQCCDLRRPDKRSGILVAPLRVPPFGPQDEAKRAEVMNSREPEGPLWKHVSLFPVLVPRADSEPELAVVDLAQMISLRPPRLAADELLASRKYALTDMERDQFRTKAAALLGRPPSDEED